jgi:hypothetical protein
MYPGIIGKKIGMTQLFQESGETVGWAFCGNSGKEPGQGWL